jgi:uncharacterized protein with HEPN domain
MIMKNNPNIFIEHILESIKLIEDYTKDLTKENFINEEFVQDAVIRRIKVVSEAVNYLSQDFMDSYPSIPWKTISDVKKSLENEEINLEMIWGTVENEIPLLKKEILKINEVKVSY